MSRRASGVDRSLLRGSVIAAYALCAGCVDDTQADSISALAADQACEDLSCPLAVNAETNVAVWLNGNVSEVVIIPPDLATISIEPDPGGYLIATVTPKFAGTGKLVVRSGGVDRLIRDIEAADIASTTCLPSGAFETASGEPIKLYPEGTEQLYELTGMRVAALHRDANGRSLLGHGAETWMIDGGSFSTAMPIPPDEQFYPRVFSDPQLFRRVVADGGAEIRVSARSQDPALVLRVLPVGSAATLALEGFGDEIRLGEDAYLWPRLQVYDRDGRYIHGLPVNANVEVESADPDVLHASASTGSRRLYVSAGRAGTTTLAIRFDGQEVRYPVRVD